MDYATAAVVMQCPIGTVRSRLHRAKALLSGKLARFEAIGLKVRHG
jgi:DNA-directed RNA polymerase specialized sigma24 family protein